MKKTIICIIMRNDGVLHDAGNGMGDRGYLFAFLN